LGQQITQLINLTLHLRAWCNCELLLDLSKESEINRDGDLNDWCGGLRRSCRNRLLCKLLQSKNVFDLLLLLSLRMRSVKVLLGELSSLRVIVAFLLLHCRR
jgi:hypothetical protein